MIPIGIGLLRQFIRRIYNAIKSYFIANEEIQSAIIPLNIPNLEIREIHGSDSGESENQVDYYNLNCDESSTTTDQDIFSNLSLSHDQLKKNESFYQIFEKPIGQNDYVSYGSHKELVSEIRFYKSSKPKLTRRGTPVTPLDRLASRIALWACRYQLIEKFRIEHEKICDGCRIPYLHERKCFRDGHGPTLIGIDSVDHNVLRAYFKGRTARPEGTRGFFVDLPLSELLEAGAGINSLCQLEMLTIYTVTRLLSIEEDE